MRSMPYEQYFGEMDLTERQLRERLLFALKFENAVLVAISGFQLDGGAMIANLWR